MLKFAEFFEFSKENFRKIPILKGFEWFEWFGPSPIEPFNPGVSPRRRPAGRRDGAPRDVRLGRREHYLGPLRRSFESQMITRD